MTKPSLLSIFWLGAAISWALVYMVIDGSSYLIHLDDWVIYLGQTWAICSVIAILATLFSNRWGSAIVLVGSAFLVAAVLFGRGVTPVAQTLLTAWILLVVIAWAVAVLKRCLPFHQNVSRNSAWKQSTRPGRRVEPSLVETRSESRPTSEFNERGRISARRHATTEVSALACITAYEGVIAGEKSARVSSMPARLDTDTLEPEDYEHVARKRTSQTPDMYTTYDITTVNLPGSLAWHLHRPHDPI